MKDKKYRKVRDHFHYTGEYGHAAHSICNLKYSVPKNNSKTFHNTSNNDYYFIIKKLTEEFQKQFPFPCLRESTRKYVPFTVPIEEEVTRSDENGKKNTKTIS